MKLCRTITVTEDQRVEHAVCVISELELVQASLIAGPAQMSFDAYFLAALVKNPDSLGRDFRFSHGQRVTWSIVIADQVNKMPLFSNTSGAKALLLVGEIISSLFEGFLSFKHRLMSVSPAHESELVLTYEIPAGLSAREALGAALCFFTMIEAILFVRGLELFSSQLFFTDEANLPSDFLNRYRFFLSEIHGR